MTRAARIGIAGFMLAVLLVIPEAPLVGAGALSSAMPHVQGTRAIVLEQLEALLAADPELQIIGQGSWLRSGVKVASKAGGISRPYGDPLLGGTSDHDLRLVMRGKDEVALAAKWRGAQAQLRDGIRSLFPKGADVKSIETTLMRYGFTAQEAAAISKQGGEEVANAVLRSVNLYSPPQLVRLVVDDKTAAAAFKRLGTVPNLAGREIEGVWGAGSAAATQEFEAGGRLFYNAGKGGLRTGFVDLVHMAEGYGRFSAGGAANMSLQWAEKAAEAINSGDLSLVAKYLKRLKSTLGLAVKKGNLPAESLRTTFGNLEQFIAGAERGEAVVLEGGRDLRAFLRTARMQASVLGELARNPGAMDREIMLAILEAQGTGRWAKVGQWFREVWPSAESLAMFERALQGAFLVFSTWQVSGTWGEQGMEDALRKAGVEGSLLLSLPVGAILMLTNSMLDSAKDFGYNTAVKPQEWREFLAGISSVKGYEGQTGLQLSIERLAVQRVSPAEVMRAVELQADSISQLKETSGAEGQATASAREAIKDRLIANMAPIVLAEWLRERKRLITAYLDLALQLDERMNNLVLSAATMPQLVTLEENGPADADVQITSSEDLKDLQDLLARMEDAIKPLGGRQHLIPFGYRASVVWEQNGKTREVSTTSNLRDLLAPQAFQFPGRGTYPLSARFKLDVRAPSLGGLDEARDVFDAQGLLARTYERTIPFTVDVVTVAHAKVEPLPKTKLTTPSEATAGDILTLMWDRSQVPNFKTGKYKVLLANPGAKLTQDDLLLMEFLPSMGGVAGDKFRYALDVLSEKTDGSSIEVQVQIPQVTEIEKAEPFDLVFLFLDQQSSASAQIDKAMKDLDKAQADLDKKMDAMTPEQREAFTRKMEEEAAKTQQAAAATPAVAPGEEPLGPSDFVSYPILVRAPGITVKNPPGWDDRPDDRPFWRSVVRKVGTPRSGDHVFIDAEFNVILGSAGLTDMAESNFAASKKFGAVRPMTSNGFTGEAIRYNPAGQDRPAGHHALRGEALLKKGQVYMTVSYGVTVTGFVLKEQNSRGEVVTVYDTRGQADAEAEQIAKDIDALLASIKVGSSQQPGDQAAPPMASAPAGDAYVRLVAAKTACEPGEFVEIQAVVENAKSGDGPFRYEWGGNHAGEGEKITFFGSNPGTYAVTVIVRGSNGVVGSTSIDITVR